MTKEPWMNRHPRVPSHKLEMLLLHLFLKTGLSGSRKTSGYAGEYDSTPHKGTPQFDAEIAEKGYLWVETR